MISIGDTVRTDDLSVPIGTSLNDGTQIWTREVDGWRGAAAAHYPHPTALHLSGEVTALVPYVETLAMHQQRFAVTCLAMGEYAGGGGYLYGAQSILERLGLDDPTDERLGIGSWVSSYVNGGAVPHGTVLLSGARDRAEGHTLFARSRGFMERLSGTRNDSGLLLLQVVGLPPGYEARVWPAPSDDEQEQIRAFRVASWEAGCREKSSRGWCEVFESSISVLGLSEDVAEELRGRGPTPAPVAGAVVASHEQMDAAPVGTVIEDIIGSTWTKTTAGLWSGCGANSTTRDFIVNGTLSYRSVETWPRFAYGAAVDNAQQRSCALGAVFAYEDGARYLLGRTDDGGGYNGTRGLTADMPNWSNTHTTVIWDGVSPIHEVPVRDHEEMNMMPIGTVIGQQWNGASFAITWTKREDGRWAVLRGGGIDGQVTAENLAIPPLRYSYIPVPGVPMPDSAPIPVEEDDPF